MFGLIVSVLLVGAALIVLLLAGAAFIQGYFYTEPSSGILWQAPVAGVVMTVFYFLWCLLNAGSEAAGDGYVPYDVFFRFSASVNLVDEPVEYYWSIKNKEKKKYTRYKVPQADGRTIVQYYSIGETGLKGPIWSPSGVEAVEIKHKDKVYRFVPQEAEEGDYRYFVSEEGWYMPEYDRAITGQPRVFHTGLFLANVLLNVIHFGLWFVCLWLILRFQWSHSLFLAAVLWGVMTVFVAPYLLMEAANLSRTSSNAPSSTPPPDTKRAAKLERGSFWPSPPSCSRHALVAKKTPDPVTVFEFAAGGKVEIAQPVV